MIPRPKVLLLCEYTTLNGGEQSMLATLPSIVAAGFDVEVALPPAGPLNLELQSRAIRCWPFALYDASGQRLELSQAREQLSELMAVARPSLLHANSLAMGRLAGPVVRDLNVPSVAHLRDIISLSSQVLADLNCHRVLLAVSHATRDYHVAAGLNPQKTRVLYNGVDLDRFQPTQPTGYLHRELQLPSGALLIASVGQLGLRKDPLCYLQAAQIVARENPLAHFLVIGERSSGKQESLELEAALHELATSSLMAGRVHFLGVRTDMASLLPELTLLVHVARQEPLGRVLLEAAACGTPVIATEVGGTAEIFPPASNSAKLIPAGEVQSLSQAMHELLADPGERQRLAQNARRRAIEMFDIEQRSAELIGIYSELLA